MPSTRVIAVNPDDPDLDTLAEAAAVLRAGGLVAFATETVYGLGADATNPEAVARIFEAKGRPPTNPLIVHADRTLSARDAVAHWPDRADRLAGRYWPGPLTMVLPRSPLVPEIVTAGQDSVGVRVPMPNVARALIRLAGRLVAAPSANRSTGISPTEAHHVLKDLDGRIDLILDSGPTAIGLESTVLDLVGPTPIVLRPGTITREELAEALGEVVEIATGAAEHSGRRSPGQMAIHYAPRTPAYRVDRGSPPTLPVGSRYALITIGPPVEPRIEGSATRVLDVHLPDPVAASNGLYRHLHACDEAGLEFLILVPPPEEPCWRAVLDRIRRATRPWPADHQP